MELSKKLQLMRELGITEDMLTDRANVRSLLFRKALRDSHTYNIKKIEKQYQKLLNILGLEIIYFGKESHDEI